MNDTYVILCPVKRTYLSTCIINKPNIYIGAMYLSILIRKVMICCMKMLLSHVPIIYGLILRVLTTVY